MVENYLQRPYRPETIDPEPSRLLLDHLFTHRSIVGLLSMDIETREHPEWGKRKDAIVPPPPGAQAREEQPPAVKTEAMEIGLIQYMDSAGQFGYASGRNEIGVLKGFWRLMATFPEKSPLPVIVTHNGGSFDLHNVDARTAILSAFEGLGQMVPRPFMKDSKYGDRTTLPQLDVGAAFATGPGKAPPKLHYLAQNLYLPGKPSQSAQDAVEMFYSPEPKCKEKAIEYMTYDVRTPLQVAYLADVLRRQFVMGVGATRGAGPYLSEPYILPPEFVKAPAKPFAEELPQHHLDLLRIAPALLSAGPKLLEGTKVRELIPSASNEVVDLIDGLSASKSKGTLGALCSPGFQKFCEIARTQAGMDPREVLADGRGLHITEPIRGEATLKLPSEPATTGSLFEFQGGGRAR